MVASGFDGGGGNRGRCGGRRWSINWNSLEEEPTRTIGDFVVAEIYCNNCGYPLGLQFIEILNDLENLVKENYFLLHLSKLLKWDGYQIVDPFQVEVGPNPVEVEDDEAGPNPVEVEDDGDDNDN
ncbi:hypothetical protein Vadar_017474 [Vaccinium darrowii]|uniref:Uncharacterized protein n=1 Tax=Vaccinium darrowii TaxID=229202 RepID=A0ACB7XAN8_9ERIC|nr:hypothetical protein Vadar_017474 [Vaccinium darrowii]